uniref:Uncharacterized protein n=2 Tax=Anopheles albimanus TaxID=7167 RepID=A0A182G0D1_ANOAL
MGLPQLSCYFKKDEQSTPIERKKIKNFITEVIASVNKSMRCYDSLRLIVLPYMMPEFQPLWRALHPTVTTNIHSLELDFKQTPDQKNLTLLTTTIPLIPNLRSLSLWSLFGPPSYIVFRHSTVQHLKLHCTNCISVDMPELQSFEGPLCALVQAYQTPQPLGLTKLKHVTLTYGSDKFYGPSIIHRLAQVETMNLMLRLTEALFLAICEACTALKSLNFWHVSVTDRAATRHLSRLANLRQLTFHSVSIEGQLPFDLDFDLVELTQLEELNLGCIALGETSVVRLPMAVRVLTVSISVANEVNVIQSLVSSSRQLEKLRLIYGGSKTTDVAVYTMKCLHLFAQLEVLVFVNAKFSPRVFADMDGPMYRMHKLRFESCELDRNNLCGLCEMFPNLALVEFPAASNWFWSANFTDAD